MFTYFRKSGRLMASLSLFALLAACQSLSEATDISEIEATPEPVAVVYVIPKGAHASSNSSFKLVNTQKLRFEVTFDSSAVYTSAKPENQFDINKLYGLSDCSTHHQVNSARFGWRWNSNRLELHAYTYQGGSRKSEFLAVAALGKPLVCELLLENGKYTFKAGEKQVTLPRGCNGNTDAYQLYPYFGGDEVAPHDIRISIRELL
mgnify:CR=1 FL=1